MKRYFVYILTNKKYGTLYIGSTSNLIKRIHDHKNKIIKGFTEKYNLDKLVYFEEHSTIEEASKREKRLKNWLREWKLVLIEEKNSEWKDLFYEVCW